jgi:cyclic pyranopterin phosphate synthase
MPAEVFGERYHFLPSQELLTFEEITRLTGILVGLGVVKVRLTGGEPLVRTQVEKLVELVSRVQGIEDLTMTTNGYLLAQKAQALKDAGLRRITVSLDSLDDQVFQQMNGRGYGTQRVLEGIEKAAAVGLTPIKINAVVQRGVNDHTMVDLARHFKGTGHIVRFIEFMDVGNLNRWKLDQVVPADEIVERINAEMPLVPVDPNYPGEVARRYRYADGYGEIGVIASVTQPFCGDCTRLRLSPEGQVYTCLFSSLGFDLKRLLRSGASDQELEQRISSLWSVRDDRYSEERAALTGPQPAKVEMYHIGG